jgi:hypothetical protein
MKERWSISENKLAAMEEGLHQEKQEYINRLEYKINYCTRCIPYLRLIFLLEVMLFFGWGCYMILQTYRVTENKATNITSVRYPPIFESLSEIQKSRPSTEVPIFVKPVIISNLENSMYHTIADPNILQYIRQQSSDLSKDATQDDHSEYSSSSIVIDERVNTRSEPGFVISRLMSLLINPSYESSDILLKDSAKHSSISQPVSVQEIAEQIENRSSDDIDARNKDKHDVNDGDMSTSTSPDTSASQDHFAFDIWMATVQNTEKQHSSESIANIKEDENYESMENKDLNKFLLPTMQNSVELTTTNVDKFQWLNVPARFADNLVRKDISKESEMQSSLLGDTYKKIFRVTEIIDDLIPGRKCEITIEKSILKVICPAIKFEEQWNFTSSEIHTVDVPKVTNSGGIIDDNCTHCDEDASEQLGVKLISNENSDIEVTTSQDSTRSETTQITDTVELQESTSTAKISNYSLPGFFKMLNIDTFGESREYTNYDYLIYNSNEGEIEQAVTTVSSSISESDSSTIDFNQRLIFETSDIQQSEQLQKSEEKDDSFSDYVKTCLQDIEDLNALEKKLTSPLFEEILNSLTRRYLPKSSYENNYYRNDICNKFPGIFFTSQPSWRERHIAFRKVLEYVKSHDFSDYYIRKKRMIDDLTWQQEHVSNTLEEDDKNADLSETLRKIFQKMEILAACIDRLHERYLLHNKLEDDYVSGEFPMETEEHRKLYKPTIVYEK